MSVPVVIRPDADSDLESALLWYSRQRAGLGAVFANRVAATIDRVSETPALYGEVAPGVRGAPVRRHPHVVYYRVFPDRVEVIAVLHGTRDPDGWRSRS